MKTLRKVKSLTGHLVDLLMICRLETRNTREVGVVTRVLLVLRAMHAGVISDDDDQATPERFQGRVDEWVGGDIQAYMLHRHQDSTPGQRDAQRCLVRGLSLVITAVTALLPLRR